MSSLPLLLVNGSGQVLQANRAALDVLGEPCGRRCCDLVRARDDAGNPICRATCSAELVGENGRTRDRGANIRNRDWRFVCTPMGNAVVVQMIPEASKSLAENPLTARERQVMELVAEGCNSREIARRLDIRPATVRTHVEHAREKLGARTRAEAVARVGRFLTAAK